VIAISASCFNLKKLNPFEAEACLNNIKNSVPKQKHFSITKISWVMIFREIAVYSENETKPVNSLCGQNA
jgi:hypothetical protein